MSGVHQPSIQEIIFFVVARPFRMYGIYFVVAAFCHTLIVDELHVLLYARYYGVFEMLNVDKVEH